jgi:hypothetical protein
MTGQRCVNREGSRWLDDFGAVTSGLRFRERSELEVSLAATGYDIVEVRDAPGRPGLEYVFVASRR